MYVMINFFKKEALKIFQILWMFTNLKRFVFLQTTGNLLVASHKTLMLYHFHVRTHDISRLRFIDFEESGVCVELSFSPTWLAVAEDIIACMSQEQVHVFRLGTGGTVERWKNEEPWLEKKGTELTNWLAFKEPRGSLPLLHKSSFGPCLEQGPFLTSQPTSFKSIWILSFYLCLGLPKGFFPSGFPTKTL